jgi:bifunctional non-homologous end joining protein LigD
VLPGAKPCSFPGFIKPCLATLRDKVTSARGFVHELKLDGYRIQARLRDGHVTLYTRTGLDWTNRFPAIAAELGRLPAGKLVIDGELISADARGRPDFSALQDDLKRGRHDRMVYYAFDLLHLDGFDTRAAPLIERKRVLQSFLAEAGASAPRVIYSEHFEDGADLYGRALGMGLEGIVSKRADAPYRSGRTEAWCKVKCWKSERFAVVGFVPEGTDGLLKLRLARREGSTLIYVGAVGTGWDRKAARSIRHALEPHVRLTSPLAKPVKTQDTRWVEPVHDAEVAYSDVTTDGMVRRPVFKALVP